LHSIIFFQDEHNNCKSEKNEKRVNYNNLFSKDPAKWVINESGLEYFLKNQVTTNFQEIQFNKTFQKIGKYHGKHFIENYSMVNTNIVIGYCIPNLKILCFVFTVYFLLHVKLNLAALVLVI